MVARAITGSAEQRKMPRPSSVSDGRPETVGTGPLTLPRTSPTSRHMSSGMSASRWGYSTIRRHHALVMVSDALARRRSGCQSGGSFYGINRHAAACAPRSHVPTASGATPGRSPRSRTSILTQALRATFSVSPQVRRALQLRARRARAEAAAAAVGHEPGRLQPWRRTALHGRRWTARGRVLHRQGAGSLCHMIKPWAVHCGASTTSVAGFKLVVAHAILGLHRARTGRVTLHTWSNFENRRQHSRVHNRRAARGRSLQRRVRRRPVRRRPIRRAGPVRRGSSRQQSRRAQVKCFIPCVPPELVPLGVPASAQCVDLLRQGRQIVAETNAESLFNYVVQICQPFPMQARAAVAWGIIPAAWAAGAAATAWRSSSSSSRTSTRAVISGAAGAAAGVMSIRCAFPPSCVTCCPRRCHPLSVRISAFAPCTWSHLIVCGRLADRHHLAAFVHFAAVHVPMPPCMLLAHVCQVAACITSDQMPGGHRCRAGPCPGPTAGSSTPQPTGRSTTTTRQRTSRSGRSPTGGCRCSKTRRESQSRTVSLTAAQLPLR